jgi:hypothetical protein
MTALLLASLYGHLECARALLEAGADVMHQPGDDGSCTLEFACLSQSLEMLQLLCAALAAISAVRPSGPNCATSAPAARRARTSSGSPASIAAKTSSVWLAMRRCPARAISSDLMNVSDILKLTELSIVTFSQSSHAGPGLLSTHPC